MKVGDLVMIRQDIEEFRDAHGEETGLLLYEYDPKSVPRLFSVLWSNNETESLYEDELDLVSKSHTSKDSWSFACLEIKKL